MTVDALNIFDKKVIDDSIKKIEHVEYDPSIGENFNKSGKISITIKNQDEYLLPSRSYIYLEGSLQHEDGSNVLTMVLACLEAVVRMDILIS